MYERARTEDEMVNQVVWRLFAKEIEKAITDEKVSYIKRIMKNLTMIEQEPLNCLDIPQDKRAKYAEMLAEERGNG